ncbi:hypothetical protein QU516_17540 (plasmid) [Moellerella wisconsensis]|uniref:hypothetical protein n=1 Tax=Moellerella wisconsensis TaxID=158849 RepID=UPI0025AEF6C5|nr:hypothetical protein [Moellerella wisconsensis]WJW83832.1 hypothetical protein QU516_17540 [Moellerella wisconsensis]
MSMITTEGSKIDSLEAMLAALDTNSETVEVGGSDLAGFSELEKMAAELNQLEGVSLEPAKKGSVKEITIVEEVIEEMDLESVLMELTEKIDPSVGSTSPELPEIKEEVGVEAAEITKPKKEKASRPRFQLSDLSEEDCSKIGLSKEVMLTSVDSCPVKAKDKALNLAQWALRGSELSIYTKLGLECIVKNGSATSESFRIYMMSNPSKPYPTGTAGTQAGQLMAVFPALGIATREGRELTLNKESPLVKLFISQLGG